MLCVNYLQTTTVIILILNANYHIVAGSSEHQSNWNTYSSGHSPTPWVLSQYPDYDVNVKQRIDGRSSRDNDQTIPHLDPKNSGTEHFLRFRNKKAIKEEPPTLEFDPTMNNNDNEPDQDTIKGNYESKESGNDYSANFEISPRQNRVRSDKVERKPHPKIPVCNSRTEKVFTCDAKLLRRFGCCPEVHECTLDNDKCHQFLYPSKCIPLKNGIFPYECHQYDGIANPYLGSTIGSRSSRNHTFSRLGYKCNTDLYDARMRVLWEKYLLCPYDKEFYDAGLAQLISDWQYNHQIMNEVCFSQNIEVCKKGTCQCLDQTFTSSTGHILLDFRQVQEGLDHCGQPAGQSCVHNNMAILQNVDKGKCTNSPDVGLTVPEPFECELDAACEMYENY
jgi:hypothetical protein